MIQITKIVIIIFTNFARFLNAEVKLVLLFLLCFFLLNTTQGQPSRLFDSDEVIELTLRGDFTTVFKDRGDDPQYHPVTLEY